MVAHHHQRTRNVLEYSLSVVRYPRRLAVHQRTRPHHFSAICLADRLMSEAYSQSRDCPAPFLYGSDGDPRFGGRARAGRDDQARYAHRPDLIDSDLVVPLHDRVLAELTEILNEVVGEGIVVVEDEKHG